MAQNEPTVTITGNLAADPELRFTQAGVAVASFTIAQTPRRFVKATNEWEDGTTLWMRCTVWRTLAENVTESLTKGTAVVATGRLTQDEWEDKETGQKRTAVKMDVDDVGPSLRFATARVTRAARTGDGGGSPKASRSSEPSRNDDPWAASPADNLTADPPF